MDLLIDGTIQRDEFERKKTQIREEQIDLENNMAGAREGDDSFKDSMIALLDVISEAHTLFKSSNVEQKRRLVNFLFANLKLKGTTLCYELRKPFDRMIGLTDSIEWLCIIDRVRTYQSHEVIAIYNRIPPELLTLIEGE